MMGKLHRANCMKSVGLVKAVVPHAWHDPTETCGSISVEYVLFKVRFIKLYFIQRNPFNDQGVRKVLPFIPDTPGEYTGFSFEARSEERRVGKECVGQCRYRG